MFCVQVNASENVVLYVFNVFNMKYAGTLLTGNICFWQIVDTARVNAN